jgi:hypothetical protein
MGLALQALMQDLCLLAFLTYNKSIMKHTELYGDFDVTESDWETELEEALIDARLYGISFLIVFEDGTVGRSTIAEVSEIVKKWQNQVALS